jgi:pimeloyl-ACP methyl ester carboxylesterase
LTSGAQVAAAIRDVLDELGVPRTVLVGHSLGGWFAANFTALFPAAYRCGEALAATGRDASDSKNAE